MPISNSFKEAVAKNNVTGIRVMMKNSMLVDPSFDEFNEMSRYAKGVSGLYDEHDGQEFKTDKSEWNDEYMNKLMVRVVNNFSHERINHLKEVVRFLRPDAAKKKSNKTSDNSTNKTIEKVGTGAAAGFVVGGVAGCIAGGVALSTIVSSAVTGAVVGGAIGGVVAAVTSGE